MTTRVGTERARPDREKRGSKFVPRCILGCDGASFKSGRAEGNARKCGEGKRRRATESFYIMRRCFARVTQLREKQMHDEAQKMRKSGMSDVTCNFSERLNGHPQKRLMKLKVTATKKEIARSSLFIKWFN